jgi:hypothetical protein
MDEEFEFDDIDELEGYEKDATGKLKSVPAEMFMVGPLPDGNVWLGLQVRQDDGTLRPVQVKLESGKAIMMGEMLMRAGDNVLSDGPVQ